MSYGNRTFQDNLSWWYAQHQADRWGIKKWKRQTKTSRSRNKKWLKRMNNRIRRHEERRDPENARTKDRFFFWAD